jgi:hypothetical protein
MIVKVNIPANADATIFLPADDPSKITQNGQPLPESKDEFIIAGESKDGLRIGFVRGSGEYTYEFPDRK